MKKTDLLVMLGKVDSKYIYEAAGDSEQTEDTVYREAVVDKSTNHSLYRLISLAAVLVLIMGTVVVTAFYTRHSPDNDDTDRHIFYADSTTESTAFITVPTETTTETSQIPQGGEQDTVPEYRFDDIGVSPAAHAQWRYNIPAQAKNTATKTKITLSAAYIPVCIRVCGYRGTYVGDNCTLDNSGNRVSSIQVAQGESVYINNCVRSEYNNAILGYISSSTYSGATMDGNWSPDTTVSVYNPHGY